jgi:Fe-S cluster biogenesis protein NfuA
MLRRLKLPFLKLTRNLFIQTEATPNQNSIKFKPGKVLMENGKTEEFLTKREAMKSPLASTLFRIEGVSSVFYGQDFITITKNQDDSWQLLKPDIFGAIMDHFTTDTPLFQDKESDTTILEEDSEVVAMIKELLDTRIRPSIQDDGGDVEFVGFENGVVKLKLRGACRTCDSSTVTLKSGIEKMLMHYVPEVEEGTIFIDI